MKLSLSILKNLIDLPVSNPKELRKILDDLGLEVKDILDKNGDVEFNIETLANRGDHLGALGVARELSARFLLPIRWPEMQPDFSETNAVRQDSSNSLEVATKLCKKIILLKAQLPDSLQVPGEIANCLNHELHAQTPLVDLCAYLSLELGHPVHAFDCDKIKGRFRVEELQQSEKIIALDAKEYTIPAGAIVGRDEDKICVVSGVIGSADSMITAQTKTVLIEAAVFDPISIRKTARAMGLSTDASYAFERGVDFNMPELALRRLAKLANLKIEAVYSFDQNLSESKTVNLNFENLKSQLASPDLTLAQTLSRFSMLGYQQLESEDPLKLKFLVPSWRLWDVEKEEDLIEDFARTISLSSVKLQLPELSYEQVAVSGQEHIIEKSRSLLHGLGYSEVITKNLYSIEEIEILQKLDAAILDQHVSIKNSLEKSYSHLKVTNLIHLGQLFSNNLKRGLKSFKVYENSRLFRKGLDSSYPYQQELDVLTMAFGGRNKVHDYRKQENPEDNFYWFKGAIESLFANLNFRLELSESKQALLHPGRQAGIIINNLPVGFFGQVHPLIQQSLNLQQSFLYAEFDLYNLDQLVASCSKDPAVISDFPVIERDLTLKLATNTFASEVIELSKKIRPLHLQKLYVVDEFKKENEDFRRVSYRYIFQNQNKTLSAEEIESEMKKLISALEREGFSLAT